MKHSKKNHYDDVVTIGCIVCLLNNYPQTPAEIHHTRYDAGIGMKSSYKKVLPLCPIHHRLGSYGIAFHNGGKKWQENFGKEKELLVLVQKLLDLKKVNLQAFLNIIYGEVCLQDAIQEKYVGLKTTEEEE